MFTKNKEFTLSKIKSIKSVGVREVWDISVKDDHSYIAENIVHHNSCEDPALHQVPKKLRTFVVANEDKAFVCMDYSSFEFRACAAKSGEPKLVEALFKREKQTPIAIEICKKYKDNKGNLYDDPDEWMKDVMGKKIECLEEDFEFFKEFIATDIHCINAASAFNKNVWEVTAVERRIGKAQPLTSKVLTPTGFKQMGDIRIGDKICTPSNEVSTVLNIFPQGVKDTYEITFSDGRKCRCCIDHLWKINTYEKSRKISKTVDTQWIINNIKRKGSRVTESNVFVDCIDPIEIHSVLPISPYFLGIWLGDGHITKENEVFITSTSETILNRLDNELIGYTIGSTSSPITYRLARKNYKGSRQIPSLGKVLANLELSNTKSDTKFIPECFLYSSVENRIALLQGLMDTDGTVTPNGQTSFCTVSIKLRDNIMELVRSLGGKCTYNTKQPFYRKTGIKAYGKILYNINIQLPSNIDVFTLTEKSNRYKVRQKHNTQKLQLSVKEVNLVGQDEMQCILIDHSDHLYVTDSFIPTHNTLGYAVLYGSGAATIRASCIKEGFFMSLDEAELLIKTFYENNPMIKEMMKQIAEEVIATHSISTLLGRRRFFDIAPKWQSDRRKRQLVDALRKAGNYVFQGANADATKLAMVRLEMAYSEFWAEENKPIIKLNVHDEIVTECNIEDIDKVIALKRPIMEEAGRVVTQHRVPISVSVSHGPQWVA